VSLHLTLRYSAKQKKMAKSVLEQPVISPFVSPIQGSLRQDPAPFARDPSEELFRCSRLCTISDFILSCSLFRVLLKILHLSLGRKFLQS
jgi:hypothetical protein